MSEALTVDLKGLAKLVERRGKAFAILELVQNAWDEDVTHVEVRLNHIDRNTVVLEVEDDSPEGFRDLSHAFTLFAESYKKGDPEKRGRFNLGEKLVIALANYVDIRSTKGRVVIDVTKNERTTTKQKRERGTLFTANLRMTKAEMEEAEQAFMTLIPPPGITTMLNGMHLLHREAVHEFEVTLATEVADGEGYLRPTRRKTFVQVSEPFTNETAMLYEMGIPVVATGDRWHVNVFQKVPLNTDRDNVTPAYLRDLRTHVVNEMAERLSEEDASANWVNEALADDLIEADAVNAVLTKRFGEKRVVFDPSDPEANRIAMAAGYTVIPGRALSKEAWGNVKSAGAARPAGQVTPSPKPFSADGEPMLEVAVEAWTPGMESIQEFACRLIYSLFNRYGQVSFFNNPLVGFAAMFGPDLHLYFNVGRLGYEWFNCGRDDQRVLDLLIHEFAHFDGSSHMSKEYDANLSRIGAQMTKLALENPTLFTALEPSE